MNSGVLYNSFWVPGSFGHRDLRVAFVTIMCVCAVAYRVTVLLGHGVYSMFQTCRCPTLAERDNSSYLKGFVEVELVLSELQYRGQPGTAEGSISPLGTFPTSGTSGCQASGQHTRSAQAEKAALNPKTARVQVEVEGNAVRLADIRFRGVTTGVRTCRHLQR